MKKRTLIIILYNTSLSIIIAALFCSCSNPFIRIPVKEDYEMVKSGKYAIVLLRIVSEADGEPCEAFGDFLPDDNYGLAVGTLKTGGKATQRTPFFLSIETKKDGWTYLLLEPGLQYLAVQPSRRTDVWTYASEFKSAPSFRIEIPLQTPLTYIGTLYIPCVGKKMLFGPPICGSFVKDKIAVNNEEDKAQKITATFFPEFRVPRTALMQPHEGPKIFKTPYERDSEQ